MTDNPVVLTKQYVPPKSALTSLSSTEEYKQEFAGWYCIEKPTGDRCSCGHFSKFAELNINGKTEHIIVVWEDEYDPIMVGALEMFHDHDMDLHIIEYNPVYGICIPYYIAETMFGEVGLAAVVS